MVVEESYRLDLFSPSRELAEKLFQSAILFFQRGDVNQAEKLYADVLANDPDHFDALHHRGIIARRLGNILDAEKFFLRALGIRNGSAPFFSNYGLVLHDLKRFEEAILSYQKSITLDPSFSPGYYNKGITLEHLGRFDGALDAYNAALLLQADYIECHNNRGNALKGLNRIDEALVSYESAIVLKPDYEAAYNNIGVALKEIAHFDQALVFYDRAIKLSIQYTAAYNNYGVVLHRLGRFKEAIAKFDCAIHLNSDFSIAHYNRGVSQESLKEFDEAINSYSAALVIAPNYADAYHNMANTFKKKMNLDCAICLYDKAIAITPDVANLYNSRGVSLQESGRVAEALNYFCKAIALMPDDAGVYSNRGMALKELKRLNEALASYEMAICVNPKYAEAFNNRGVALQDLKRFDDAIDSFKAAVNFDGNTFHAYSNLLFTMNYVPSLAVVNRLEEARNFGAVVASKVKNKFSSWLSSNKSTKLKVGFVSGDFRNHPVGYFLEGLISKIDKTRYELFAYSTILKEDDLTQRLKCHVPVWRSIVHQSDAEAAETIHTDGLNILIDLAGHTAGNRLSIFAYKPAPVQASWLGYFATTGVAEIDYFIGDSFVAPYGEEKHFVERVIRFPETYFCFTPPQSEIEVGPLPALKNGYVTFGCFNNLAKINSAVVDLWAKVLNVVEGSKLFLKSRQLGDLTIIQSTIEEFSRAGIPSDRLVFEGPSDRQKYFEAFNRVDIALDPFPFPGGTTTVEGLWMGVPVVTLRGDRFIAHNGETIAFNSGQSAWVAMNEDDYCRKAKFFATDLIALAKLRSGLRRQVLRSPLFDSERFARNFEHLICDMWVDHQK